MIKLYYTIDDAPSKYLKSHIDFMVENGMKAVLFVRGEFMEEAERLNACAYAIHKGFHIGNHSYTHPYFSKIPFEFCVEEIEKTERLIEKAYIFSGVKRPLKFIRLPFGDLGGENAQEIETYLKNNDFQTLTFENIDLPQNSSRSTPWTFDLEDYKSLSKKHPEKVVEKILNELLTHKNASRSHIILAHDFDDNFELFRLCLKKFLHADCQFLLPHGLKA